MGREAWSSLAIGRGAGLFATFGCYGCQLAGRGGEGYGLSAIRNPRGPVAACGSHGECWAAMALLLAEGLLTTPLEVDPAPRLGDLWIAMKRHLAEGTVNPVTYAMLNMVDGDPNTPQAVQRKEHLEMFLLLGDPALSFPQMPLTVSLRTEGAVTPGGAITVRGTVPKQLAGAGVTISLSRPLNSEPVGLLPLTADLEPPERTRRLLANHRRSNRFVLAERTLGAAGGRFEARLELPDPLPWPKLILRVYAATETQEAMGVSVLR
jgi:hypothetical protein